MRRWFLRWLGRGILLGLAIGYIAINYSGHDPVLATIDPVTVARTGSANDFLAAPQDATQAQPSVETRVHPVGPDALLGRFKDIALSAPRVEMLAQGPDPALMNFVQRSGIVGFPDYIAVRAVAVGEGSALIVYSRSRYGSADFGVNRARVTSWLKALDEAG